jgi:hypothetical protein
MQTWHSLLCIPNAFRSLHVRVTIHLDMWLYTSIDLGIGIIIGQKWQAWKLLLGWNHERRDIGWIESAALELAVLEIASHQIRHAQVVVHQNCMNQFSSGHFHNSDANLCIRRSVELMMHCSFTILTVYAHGVDNRASSLSHEQPLLNHLRLPHVFKTPDALASFLSDV